MLIRHVLMLLLAGAVPALAQQPPGETPPSDEIGAPALEIGTVPPLDPPQLTPPPELLEESAPSGGRLVDRRRAALAERGAERRAEIRARVEERRARRVEGPKARQRDRSRLDRENRIGSIQEQRAFTR